MNLRESLCLQSHSKPAIIPESDRLLASPVSGLPGPIRLPLPYSLHKLLINKISRGTGEAGVPLSTPNTTGITHPDHHIYACYQQHSMQDSLYTPALQKPVQPPEMFYLQLCSPLPWPEAGYGQAQVKMEDGTEKPTDVASCQLPQWLSSIPGGLR